MSVKSRHMSRRAFGRLLAVVVVSFPGVAISQTSKAIRRIGVLEVGDPETAEQVWKQAEPLRSLGWVEGQNLHVERLYDYGRPDALQSLADKLVRARVEIIVTAGTLATLAAKRATSTIPIVFRGAGDPVLSGLVVSLASPGGNVTGYSYAFSELSGKNLSLLKELVPRLERVGALWQAGNPYTQGTREQFERACQSLGLVPIIVEIDREGDIAGAIARLEAQRAQAVAVPSGGFFWDHRREIVDAVTKRGLATVTDAIEMVRDGAVLLAYANASGEEDGIRAEYIDRILRGARPADLPVRQPKNLALAINLKTANALGLVIPQALLLRADEVIQ